MRVPKLFSSKTHLFFRSKKVPVFSEYPSEQKKRARVLDKKTNVIEYSHLGIKPPPFILVGFR